MQSIMAEDRRSHPRNGDSASKIAINGAITRQMPNISGFNFFSGDFTPKTVNSVGTAVCTQEEWDAMWKTLDRPAPGPLPDSTRAIFQAINEATKQRATAFEAANVTLTATKDIKVEWNRLHVGKDEDPKVQDRFAVLLVPEQGKLSSSFNDVWPLREKREKMKKFDESLNLFRKGQSSILTSPSVAKFTQYQARRNVKPQSRN